MPALHCQTRGATCGDGESTASQSHTRRIIARRIEVNHTGFSTAALFH